MLRVWAPASKFVSAWESTWEEAEVLDMFWLIFFARKFCRTWEAFVEVPDLRDLDFGWRGTKERVVEFRGAIVGGTKACWEKTTGGRVVISSEKRSDLSVKSNPGIVGFFGKGFGVGFVMVVGGVPLLGKSLEPCGCVFRF